MILGGLVPTGTCRGAPGPQARLLARPLLFLLQIDVLRIYYAKPIDP